MLNNVKYHLKYGIHCVAIGQDKTVQILKAKFKKLSSTILKTRNVIFSYWLHD